MFYFGYCLTCFESPLTITARIPVGGYIPGQTIPLNFTADNQSILDVLKFKAQLIKVKSIEHFPNFFEQTLTKCILCRETTSWEES